MLLLALLRAGIEIHLLTGMLLVLVLLASANVVLLTMLLLVMALWCWRCYC